MLWWQLYQSLSNHFSQKKQGIINNMYLVDPAKERVQDTNDPNLEMHDLGPVEGDLLPIQE